MRHAQVCSPTNYYVGAPMADGYGYVRRAGDQMAGSLLAWRDPIQDMEVVTKRYADTLVGSAGSGLPTGGIEGQALAIDAAGIPTWGAPLDGGNF